MRPEMNETEAIELERLLRDSVARHRPAAPDALLEFIETVPTRERQSGPIDRIFGGRMARRGVLGLAAAAAVVVALVGSAALMSSRKPSVPASEPANVSDGWAWQATDGTLYTAALAVPKGFIGICGHNSGQDDGGRDPVQLSGRPALVRSRGPGHHLDRGRWPLPANRLSRPRWHIPGRVLAPLRRTPGSRHHLVAVDRRRPLERCDPRTRACADGHPPRQRRH